MARFRNWLKNRAKERQLIEQVVDTVEPKIKLAGGYRKHLRKPIQICLAHCASIVANIPGPIYLKDSDFDANPFIHAAFLGSVKLEQLLQRQDVDLNSHGPSKKERYALLTMTHRQSTTFGPKLDGNMILSDTPMQTVTFADHKIVGLSTSLRDSKRKLEKTIFQMILEEISRELASRRTNLKELREHLERLEAMSDIFSGETEVRHVFGHSSQKNLEKLKQVELMLKQSKDELTHARQGNETAEDWLEMLVSHLSSPEKIMNVERITMRLDWRNVLTEDTDEKASEIIMAQCSLTEEMQRQAVFISYRDRNDIES